MPIKEMTDNTIHNEMKTKPTVNETIRTQLMNNELQICTTAITLMHTAVMIHMTLVKMQDNNDMKAQMIALRGK